MSYDMPRGYGCAALDPPDDGVDAVDRAQESVADSVKEAIEIIEAAQMDFMTSMSRDGYECESCDHLAMARRELIDGYGSILGLSK